MPAVREVHDERSVHVRRAGSYDQTTAIFAGQIRQVQARSKKRRPYKKRTALSLEGDVNYIG